MNAVPIPRSLLVLLAVAAGASVANVYYAQPLLDRLAEAFALERAVAGAVLAATQAGSGTASPAASDRASPSGGSSIEPSEDTEYVRVPSSVNRAWANLLTEVTMC